MLGASRGGKDELFIISVTSMIQPPGVVGTSELIWPNLVRKPDLANLATSPSADRLDSLSITLTPLLKGISGFSLVPAEAEDFRFSQQRRRSSEDKNSDI